MDMGCLSFSVWIMIVCLFGSMRFSSSEICPCPRIPLRHLTEPPPDECYQPDDRYRYKCIKDYVRKVGTSNLIICKNNAGTINWTTPSLECIPHPDKPRPPNVTPHLDKPRPPNITQSHSHIPPDSIFTTTVKTPTTLQNDSATPLTHEGTNPVQPPSQETSTQPTNTCTTQNTTTPSTTNNSNDSSSYSNAEKMQAVHIGVPMVIIISCIIGLGFFLYRRRSRGTSPQGTPKEMEQLNDLSGRVA